MEHNITILFYTRIKRKNKNNQVPIYLRITVNGKRIEQTTKRSVDRAKWSPTAGKLKGTHSEAKVLNSFLDVVKNKVYMIERGMIQDGIEITYQTFRDRWFGAKQKAPMVLEAYKQHNEELALLVGKDYAPLTVKRYTTSLKHTREFINWKYKEPDIEINKLNYEFISSYSFYLKSVRNCNHNSTMKSLKNFKKIVLLCIKNGWLSKDPFIGFKLNTHEVERPFLSQLELNEIAAREFPAQRLNYVKDIFLFSCYTGLAYVDVQKLKRSEIGVGVDGEKWIFVKRQKTDTPAKKPILPVAEELMNKYKDHPQCIIQDKLLPVFSNQK